MSPKEPSSEAPYPESADPNRILIVDDDPGIRQLLHKTLAPAGYRIAEAATAAGAIAGVREGSPDLVILDLNLPDASGHDVLERIRSDPATRLLPVIVLTGLATTTEKRRAQAEGVTDFVAKPFAPDELLPRVRALLVLKRFADEHEHAEHVVLTLAKLIDARDAFTAGHSGRVAEYADRIAQRLGVNPTARADMRRGALFLDIGKIVIPDSILHKTAPLTEDERDVIEEHTLVGHDLLSPMKTMARALPIVRSHHEKLDGSGYPDGLSGDDIPLIVRIVTISDIFDALTADRSYRRALPVPTAFEILREGVAKGWWNGDAVAELAAAVDEMGMLGRG